MAGFYDERLARNGWRTAVSAASCHSEERDGRSSARYYTKEAYRLEIAYRGEAGPPPVAYDIFVCAV
jgi:hypothetical protein